MYLSSLYKLIKFLLEALIIRTWMSPDDDLMKQIGLIWINSACC